MKGDHGSKRDPRERASRQKVVPKFPRIRRTEVEKLQAGAGSLQDHPLDRPSRFRQEIDAGQRGFQEAGLIIDAEKSKQRKKKSSETRSPSSSPTWGEIHRRVEIIREEQRAEFDINAWLLQEPERERLMRGGTFAQGSW